MRDWQKFSEPLLPKKEEFYSHLKMEDNTDADYTHTERVCKDFEIKNLEKNYDLQVQSETLLLAEYLGSFERCVLKYRNLIMQNFFQLLDWHDKQLQKSQKEN